MITSVQPLVTRSAPFSGATPVSIASFVGDWTLVVNVLASGPDTVARMQFTDQLGQADPVFNVTGGVQKNAPLRFSFRRRDFPDAQFGVANATLKLDIALLTGTNPTITYEAWIQT